VRRRWKPRASKLEWNRSISRSTVLLRDVFGSNITMVIAVAQSSPGLWEYTIDFEPPFQYEFGRSRKDIEQRALNCALRFTGANYRRLLALRKAA
jgi:hypothetical protein